MNTVSTEPFNLDTKGLVAVSHGTVVTVIRKGSETAEVSVPGLLSLSVAVVETTLYLSRRDVEMLYALTEPHDVPPAPPVEAG